MAKEKGLNVFVVFGDRRSKKYKRFSSIQYQPRFQSKRLATLSIIFKKFDHINQFFFSPGVLLAIIKFKPDVVLTEGTSNIFNNLLICNYCLLTKTPYIWWDLGKVRGQKSENIFRRIIYPVIQFYINRAAIILAYSTYARQYFILNKIKKEKIIVAYNTIRLEKHLEYQELNRDKAGMLIKSLNFNNNFIFLSVGGLDKTKRFDLLIEVFLTLEKEFNNIALIIVGNGDELENLKSLASSSNKIYFAGEHFEDIGLYFSISNILVLPGLGGLVMNESMVYGLPVIAGPADGTELDIILNNNNGFLLDSMTKKSLLEKMHWCVLNPEKIKEMGQNAKKHILTKYSFINMMDNIKNSIYKAYDAKNQL